MKFFVIFAAFLGLTSGATIKEQLLEKLTNSEHRLNDALAFSHAHQLTFHQGVYETWLNKIAENRKSIEQLSDNVQPGQITEKVEKIVEQEKEIASLVVDPSPRETAKTSAISLAAMKLLSSYETDHQTAQKLIDDVLEIVKKEASNLEQSKWVSDQKWMTFPNFDLSQMYDRLKDSTSGWNIPGFEDYYKLANKTRVLIEAYRDHGMAEDTTKMEEHLRKYDEITIQMARSWPIAKEKDVDHYYALAKTHREHEIVMETPKQPPHTVKDRFLDELYASQKNLHEAIERFHQRSQNYYADWLSLQIEPLNRTIQNIKKRISHYPSNDEVEINSDAVQLATGSVKFSILRPAPAETFKAAILYIAGIEEVNNNTVTSARIKAEVAAIMHKEATFLRPEMALRQRVNALEYNQELESMRGGLKKMLKSYGYKNLRGMNDVDDDLELENKVRAKIQDLKEAGKTQEAWRGAYDLGLFTARTFKMNSLLPIDSDAKLELYYLSVKDHYDYAQLLQAWLSQTHH